MLLNDGADATALTLRTDRVADDVLLLSRKGAVAGRAIAGEACKISVLAAFSTNLCSRSRKKTDKSSKRMLGKRALIGVPSVLADSPAANADKRVAVGRAAASSNAGSKGGELGVASAPVRKGLERKGGGVAARSMTMR